MFIHLSILIGIFNKFIKQAVARMKLSVPTYHVSGELKGRYPHDVPFNMFGLPDFSRYSVKTLILVNLLVIIKILRRQIYWLLEKIILLVQKLLQVLFGIMIQEG